MGKVSIVEAARAADAFRKAHWRDPVGPQVLIVIGSTLQALWKDASPVAAGLAGLVEMVGSLMVYGALFRLALADAHPDDPAFRIGRSGFQWRRLEWRLIGLGLLMALLFVAPAMLFAVASYALMGGESAPDALPPAVWVAGLLLGCGLVYGAVRLSLAFPASADKGRIRLFSTWPLTRGQFWPLLGAHLLILAVIIGVSLVALVPAVLAGMAASVAASFAGLSGKAVAGAFAALATSGVQAFVALPLSVGLSVALYRTLSADGDSAS